MACEYNNASIVRWSGLKSNAFVHLRVSLRLDSFKGQKCIRVFSLVLQGPAEQVTNDLYHLSVLYLQLLVVTATSVFCWSFCRVVEVVQLCHPSLELCKSFIRLEQTKTVIFGCIGRFSTQGNICYNGNFYIHNILETMLNVVFIKMRHFSDFETCSHILQVQFFPQKI